MKVTLIKHIKRGDTEFDITWQEDRPEPESGKRVFLFNLLAFGLPTLIGGLDMLLK